MKELGEKIVSYWGNRAEGYSEYNREELAGDKWQDWIAEIKKQLPKKEKPEIRILDIGTGPGFFAVLLAQEGYQVTAIDCTAEMLAEAQANAGALAAQITWRQMDAQKLEFADESFNLVLSRNLTWVLEEPETAYAEWYRVLKPAGILLNFDCMMKKCAKATKPTVQPQKQIRCGMSISIPILMPWKKLRKMFH